MLTLLPVWDIIWWEGEDKDVLDVFRADFFIDCPGGNLAGHAIFPFEIVLLWEIIFLPEGFSLESKTKVLFGLSAENKTRYAIPSWELSLNDFYDSSLSFLLLFY